MRRRRRDLLIAGDIFAVTKEFAAMEREKTAKHKSLEFAKRIVRLYRNSTTANS
jgi:hypothetical protein